MYSECIKCQKLGKTCDGPRFVAMSTAELLAWCKERKKELHKTNAQLADASGVPKGTIDRLFAGDHTDFRYESIRPLLKALVGREWKGMPCEDDVDDDTLQARLAQCEKDLQEAEKKITFLKEQVRFKESQMQEKDKLLAERGAFMKRKDRIIAILAAGLAVCLLLLIAALVIDRTNSGVGFFWLEGILHLPNSIIDKYGISM